ncbi:MAG: hypothetical protein UX49_C0016G0018 [Candidatus Wolfebacteria bacterium GW2011_GWC2_46_275]|uniref:Uncharacterized protein n=1 Tax=Candidatus Wolfebacteria bacterium GW2011_GWB1_47_1 TaxID=1619007 RepID=A0A0G4AQJ3_9BACT|nr:MAG: hypothetical protein UX70_C0001G0026 [Candidatus Wolfebacteria bacterium GW2011_GWB1_47_1]KKU36425.1 MAG: hypothetical protein UX49_C0016G0018 [Candidatus Wolfebacteria bacterium GW2011_GWC2_46_275]KKU41738.1 MAG: hypothetical protein UX58_C0006G0047 [Candidatus Wolfebacteria bacterium GW2011_GWB2_46_69]KKU53968.1 MAG: hypothetical protein UX76_C0007G0027 [Candidatus Wolfebacteria bacterium GW2011_GWC1_47_103]KKU72090.1 MAG: hypothetical protein UX96_C0017G0018 [Candidatus Wolfebacteria
MEGQELYKKVYREILDYSDGELIGRCAKWGYEVEQKLSENEQFLIQGGAESASSFMYAVATAVIVGEFAKHAYNDYFSEETEIDLGLLDMEFEQIRGFLGEDITQYRLTFLKEGNSIGLQDIWTAISEWKQDIYKSLIYIYKQENKDPEWLILNSLTKIFEKSHTSITDARRIEGYEYINSGFNA